MRLSYFCQAHFARSRNSFLSLMPHETVGYNCDNLSIVDSVQPPRTFSRPCPQGKCESCVFVPIFSRCATHSKPIVFSAPARKAICAPSGSFFRFRQLPLPPARAQGLPRRQHEVECRESHPGVAASRKCRRINALCEQKWFFIKHYAAITYSKSPETHCQ